MTGGVSLEVRRRVLRQLCESLLYEGLLPPDGATGVDGVAWRWESQRRFSFDRLRLGPAPVTRTAAGAEPVEVTAPARLLHELAPVFAAAGVTPGRRAAFAVELERTVANDTAVREHWHRERRRAAGAGYDELESLVVDGHPYHPSYKSRLGFDPSDNASYGPEFSHRLRPEWLALHRDVAEIGAAPGVEARAWVERDLGPATVTAFWSALAAGGRRPADYVAIPVHPWQWRTQVSPGADNGQAFAAWLADGRLVPLGRSADEYRAQQSIRTLANVTRPDRASLKLALSIVTTSTARTLASHAVANAPLITGWLRRIVAADPYLAAELRPVILGEVVGVAAVTGPGEPAGVLGALWRESLRPALAAGEEAAPLSALCHVDATGEAFVARWVADQGVEAWAGRVLEVVITPVLHFLVAHGIALEAHAQNLILIHRAGRPVRIALRDFGDGIRFSAAGLADPAGRPTLRPTPEAHLRVNRSSYVEASSDDDVRDFAVDCLFFVNLAELAMFLADRFGLAERRFWDLARRVVEDHRRRFPEHAARAARFDVTAPEVAVEQLATRRLLPDSEVRLQRVRNPLARVAR